MESNLEIRLYECGCVDRHNSALWSSTCVEHCPDHCWIDGELAQPHQNPAHFEGIPYIVIYEDD